MDKKALANHIRQGTGNLFEKIYMRREHHHDTLMDILQRASTACKGEEVSAAFGAYLKELEKEYAAVGQLPDTYLSLVEEVASRLDDEVVLEQSEQRFVSAKEDSPVVDIMKAGKRLIRNLDKGRNAVANSFRRALGKKTKEYHPWKQHVPLRRLAKYHLGDKQALLKKWMDRDAHMWVQAADLLSGISNEDLLETTPVVDAFESLIQDVRESRKALSKQKNSCHKEVAEELTDWAYKTGTIERRTKFYTALKGERKQEQAEAKLFRHFEQWQKVFELASERTATIADFLQFDVMIHKRSKELSTAFDDHFEVLFSEPFNRLTDQLNEVQNSLAEGDAEAVSLLLQESREELSRLFEQMLDKLKDAIENGLLSKESEKFSEQVFLAANDLKKETQFLSELDLDASPPNVSNRNIEWRILVVRALKEKVLAKVHPSAQDYDAFLQKQVHSIAEVKEVVDVNFDTAAELSKGQGAEAGGEGNPHEVIEESIDRTLSKVKQIKDTVEEKREGLKLTLIDNVADLVNNMLRLIKEGDSKQLQVIDARYRVKETAQGWRTKVSARWARLQDRLLLVSRFGWKKIKQYWSRIKQFLGFEKEQVQEVKKADIATYLTETDAKISELPYIYRKLFNFDVDSDRRFYVSPNENFNYLKKSLESWENGFPSTFATVGEKGSGKSTYLSLVLDEFFDAPKVKQLTLNKTYWTSDRLLQLLKDSLGLARAGNKEEVVEEINESCKGSTLMVEALQNLYLRNVNGYQAIEDFMYIISETRHRVFWIVSISRYAWNYLNVTHSLGDYFSHVMRTDMLDESAIEAVIMNRHRSSGYELVFEPGELHAKSRAYRKLLDREEEAQQYLKESYFEDLAGLAEGNPSIAMIFWIRSIRNFDDTHCYIKPLEITTLEMVQELKPEVLFTLASIILHDALSPKELSLVLQFEDERSRLILNQLQAKGLVLEKDGQYAINQLMYRQVVRVLKERNIIHLV